MIVALPAATPLTRPVVELTEATDALLLAHVPPIVASVNSVVLPVHNDDEPLIAAGAVVTVRMRVAMQLVANVYVIVALPEATPVTIPLVPTVATAVLLLLHAPPVVASAKVVVSSGQTDAVPVIAAGFAFVVNIAVTRQPVARV